MSKENKGRKCKANGEPDENGVVWYHIKESEYDALEQRLAKVEKLKDARSSVSLLHQYREEIEDMEGPSSDYIFKNLDVVDIDRALKQIEGMGK